MFKWHWLRNAALVAAVFALFSNSAAAAGLKEEMAPTGKLRVAIVVTSTPGVYWSSKAEGGYAGVPVALGKAMATKLGVPVDYVEYENTSKLTEAAGGNSWDVAFLPKDPEREKAMAFGPTYDISDATFLVRAGSTITNFATLDHAGTEVAAVEGSALMRSTKAHLKKATTMAFKTYDEAFNILLAGEVDAFAHSRDVLMTTAKKIPGTKILDENFAKIASAAAVPLKRPQALAFVTSFITEANTNGTLRKAFDDNGLKDIPLRTQ